MWPWLAIALLALPQERPTVQDALRLEQQGQEGPALQLLDAVVREQPAWEIPRLEAARIRLKQGTELDRAQLDLDVARTIAPENPRAHYLWGLLREEAHADDDALFAYREALALRPGYDDARLRLAGIYFAHGDWKDAEAQYRELSRRRPEWSQARLQLALTLDREGRVDDAIADLEALRAQDPESKVTLRRLAELYERTGRAEQARKLREELSPKRPERRLRPLRKSRR